MNVIKYHGIQIASLLVIALPFFSLNGMSLFSRKKDGNTVRLVEEDIQDIKEQNEQFWQIVQEYYFNKDFLHTKSNELLEIIEKSDRISENIEKNKDHFPKELALNVHLYKKRLLDTLAILNDFKHIDLIITHEDPLLIHKANEHKRIKNVLKAIPADPLKTLSQQEIESLQSALRIYKSSAIEQIPLNNSLIQLSELLVRSSKFYKDLEKKGTIKKGKIKVLEEWVDFV